jgi:hypothetical protein
MMSREQTELAIKATSDLIATHKYAIKIEESRLEAYQQQLKVKTGRVMSVDDMVMGTEYFTPLQKGYIRWSKDSFDLRKVALGQAFHDKASCEQYLEQLKCAQKLRVTIASQN